MEEQRCADCHYYLQHYTLDNKRIFRVFCGHCTLYPAKRKRPDTKSCEHFVPGSPQKDAFATKEYLSKELLQYLLHLELLPTIEEQE